MELHIMPDPHPADRSRERDPVYPDPENYPTPLPPDLRAAFLSAEFLLDKSTAIASLLTLPLRRTLLGGSRDDSDLTSAITLADVTKAITHALELRGKIKECESAILACTNEITSTNKTPVQAARLFENAHRALLDTGALVCELVWDGAYRERGFDSPQELYSLPLTPEVVIAGLPVIAPSLQHFLGWQDWEALRRVLLIEIATTAAARSRAAGAAPQPKAAAESGAAAAAPPIQSATDDEDERILHALAKHSPRLLTQDAIEAESRVSRRTISNRIKQLLKAGLITQPKGPKSGTTISDSGLELLKQIDRTRPAR
jgi:hypothetical protein